MADANIDPLVTELRERITTMYRAYNDARAVEMEFGAAGYDIEEGDLVGSNTGITEAEVVAGFTTLDAIEALMAAGHRTNLAKLVKR